MGEKLYYIVEIIIFSSIAGVFILSPQLILKGFKKEISKEKIDIIRLGVVVVAVINVFMNIGKLFQ